MLRSSAANRDACTVNVCASLFVKEASRLFLNGSSSRLRDHRTRRAIKK
jgi:hypothetical protein